MIQLYAKAGGGREERQVPKWYVEWKDRNKDERPTERKVKIQDITNRKYKKGMSGE